jgi:hypothetical protein
MLYLLSLSLIAGQFETVDSATFSREMQQTAVAATVRVTNVAREVSGSGVVIAVKGPCAYVLTAFHVIDKAEGLEVATFTGASYPRPDKVYRAVTVVARAADVLDLALLRITLQGRAPEPMPLCPAGQLSADAAFEGLTVGCADGGAPTCLVEKVLGKKLVRREAEDKKARFWELAGKQQEGRSGGPLVDPKGRLLGVCSGTNGDKSYYCHADEVRAFLQRSGVDDVP